MSQDERTSPWCARGLCARNAAQCELAELPSVVRHLEADARMIRQKVEQLNDAATKAGPRVHDASDRSAEDASLERREALDRELNVARDAAKQRLADAVTALETIRLDLLGLTAGAGSVDSLTADLTEARAVSEEVGRLLDARDEMEALMSSHGRPQWIGDPATRQMPAPSAGGGGANTGLPNPPHPWST